MKSSKQGLKWITLGKEKISEKVIIYNNENERIVKSELKGFRNLKEFSLEYIMHLTPDWRVKDIQITSSFNLQQPIHLNSDLQGNWFSKDGEELSRLNGCIDIDISITPFTNSLPIKRLDHKLESRTKINVVYFDISNWSFRDVTQYYTRIGKDLYHYEGIENNYVAEIQCDQNGFVLNYPETFERVFSNL